MTDTERWRASAALQRGDVEAMREGSHPDVVIVQPPEVPDAKSYEGHAGIAEAFEDWPSQWEDFRLELLDVIDVSDTEVIAVTRQRSTAYGPSAQPTVAGGPSFDEPPA